jgi:hypothetical protein
VNIYEAIMAAADHIEQNPQDFNFCNGHFPRGGLGACPLVWIGLLGGIPHDVAYGEYCNSVSLVLTGDARITEFFERCSELGSVSRRECSPHVLRAYAAKYHAPSVPRMDLPAAVRAIFEDAPAL